MMGAVQQSQARVSVCCRAVSSIQLNLVVTGTEIRVFSGT